MPKSAKPPTGADIDVNVCPACHQPIKTSTGGDDLQCTDPSGKRKNGTSQQAASAASKKLRSADTAKDGKGTTIWESRENYPVWVRVYDGLGGRGWVPGIVHQVHHTPEGPCNIVVYIEDENGNMIIPRTIKETNQDPIPSVKKKDPNYKLRDYIVSRDDCLAGLSDVGVKHWRCLKYHSDGSLFDDKDVPSPDVIGKSLLSDDPESRTTIRNIFRSLMVDKNVKKVVKIVTGEETCSPQHALAYFIGQLSGIELSEATSSNNDIDPNGLLNQIGSNHKDECPISQVFLLSAMSVRTRKAKTGVDPTGQLYDSRGRAVLSDPKKLSQRMKRLQTALAAIHSSQSNRPFVTGPSFALLSHGIHLMIDMRGTSDRLLDQLAEEGICRPASVIRMWIQRLADAIDPLNSRCPPPSGQEQVVAWTGDNADFHIFCGCVNVVPVGNVLLGTESEDDSNYFNQKYVSGLGKLSDLEAEELAPTEDDDKVAQEVIDNQNILALLDAALDFDVLAGCVKNKHSATHSAPALGSTIKFTYRSKKREGSMKETSKRDVSVEFSDGGRTVRRLIPMEDVHFEEDNAPVVLGPSSSDPKKRKSHRPEMFEGQRHRFDPTTTSLASVLTGLSSKNNETARQMIREIISQYGKDRFWKAVHVIVADQEFMPTIINEFFSRLGRQDQLPILPCLAIGHAMKGVCVSMMSYYSCIFDPMLEAMGIKVGSPEHSRYYKGKVIRKTNALVCKFTEMGAVAAAHQYIHEVGTDERIEVRGVGKVTPISIINSYLESRASKVPDPTARSVTVMDTNMRPYMLRVTPRLKSLACDFQKWAREKWGTFQRREVGPSGYQRRKSEAETQQEDPVQKQWSQEIEDDAINYKRYLDMKYGDDGDELGLFSLCRNANLLENSSRKDKETLAKKFYLHDHKKEHEKAVKFGPSRKIPKGTNSTALAFYDLMFGVERYVLVQGQILQRIRPKDRKLKKNERYPQDWLVFFKALTVSNFMRWQPNYQRLSLSFLIQLNLILKHKDPRCIDLTLKRIRLTFCTSESGDSHKCTPVDLLQEHSLVELVKGVGQRDPSSYHNLESRCLVRSYFQMKKIESRVAGFTEFSSISPDYASKIAEESSIDRSIVTVWLSILGDIHPLSDDTANQTPDEIQGLGDEDSKLQVADASRAYFRTNDALDHFLLTGTSFIRGLIMGTEVAMPLRRFGTLRQFHRTVAKRKANVLSVLTSTAKKARIDAEQSLTEDNQVIVSSSSSILDDITNAGTGKAGIYPAVLSTMSHNRPYVRKDGQIGDGPSKPVMLARTKFDAVRLILQRAKRGDEEVSPIFQHVDTAKDLHGFIARYGAGPNTVEELAKDIICEMVNKYYFVGVELICLTMDVAAHMSRLRIIPHTKRGKMDAVKIPHGKLSKVRKGTNDLTPYGARSDLLTCGDQCFMELLFNTMCDQAQLLEKGEWSLHCRVSPFALAVVGGSPQACVVVGIEGKQSIRLNTGSILLPCQSVQEELYNSKIVKCEEGEMMVFGAFRTIIEMGFTHENSHEGVDCVAIFQSEDSDTFAGMSMQAIFYLESTCILRDRRFLGAVYIKGPKKSVSQITKLGNIFRTNYEIDPQLCPTGRGFEFFVDIISVYYTLEQNSNLPELPKGHRAISTVAVPYTLVNHDYLKMGPHGLSYTKIIATMMKSASYKSAIKQYDQQMASPVNFTRQAVFMSRNHTNEKGYNLPGVLLLLHHAFINRSATKKKLLEKYSTSDLANLERVPYKLVRAAAILAGEKQPLPDPIVLISHLSASNLILRRWSMHVYNGSKSTDSEFDASSYTESEVKGRKVISIDYNLCRVAEVYRHGWSDEVLIRKLRQSCFGYLLPVSGNASESPMPFNPMEEVRRALNHDGYYPWIKVPGEVLPSPPVPKDRSTTHDSVEGEGDEMLAELLEEADENLVDTDESASEGERSVAGSLSSDESEEELDEDCD